MRVLTNYLVSIPLCKLDDPCLELRLSIIVLDEVDGKLEGCYPRDIYLLEELHEKLQLLYCGQGDVESAPISPLAH